MGEPRSIGPPLAAAIVSLALVVSATWGERAPAVAEPSPLEGYRVVYGVEDRSGERIERRREVLEVRRPYDGRIEVAAREGSASGSVTNRDFRWQLGAEGELRFGLRRPPGGPVRDVSYEALRDAVDDQRVVAVGRGAALGRDCTWFASKDPFPELLVPPTPDSRVDSCVDAGGVLLREVWRIGGRVVSIREATEVEPVAPGKGRFLAGRDPDEEDVSQPEAADILRSQTVVADGPFGDEGPIALPRAPRGWKIGRDSRVGAASPVTGRAVQTAWRAYVRGIDLVVVEGSLRGEDEPTWPRDEGAAIDVPIGSGRIVYFADHVEIRVTTDGFARVLAPSRELALVFVRGMRSRD